MHSVSASGSWKGHRRVVWSRHAARSAATSCAFAGEVSSGVLKSGSKSYLVVVGQHPRGDSKNGATMIFDLSKQTWQEASSRPEIGNHHASEVIGNKLYLFGGLSDGEGDVQIGSLKNTKAGIDISWKKGAGLPFDGGSAATALIGGKVRPIVHMQDDHPIRRSCGSMRLVLAVFLCL